MQNSPSDDLKLSAQLTTLKIIWVALFCSQILYLYVVTMTSKNFQTESTLFDSTDPMSFPMVMMSAIALAAAAYLPKILSKSSNRRVQNQIEPADSPSSLFKAYVVPFIVRLALLESVALYGFILAILHHDPKRMLIFMLASMIGYIASFPSLEKFRAGY